MTADINIFTADSKLRFPFPREVRFKRSAHSAVPTSVVWMFGGLEDLGGILFKNLIKYCMGEPWGLLR